MTTIFTEKKENSIKLKKELGLLLKYKPLWLIKITDNSLLNELIEWFKELPIWFIIFSESVNTEILSKNIAITSKLDNNMLSWFDFIVCDNEIELLDLYLKNWVTPIINKNNYLSSILKEFDPLKNDWNTFFYDNMNKYSIFYSIIRYIENYKFPFDNKNLVKNVLKIN